MEHLVPESNHQRILGIDIKIDGAVRCPETIGQPVLTIDLQSALIPHNSLSKIFGSIVYTRYSLLLAAGDFSFLIANLGISTHIGIGDLLDMTLSVHIGEGVLLHRKPSGDGFLLHPLRLLLHIRIELGSSLFTGGSDTLGILLLRDRLFTGFRNVLRGHFDGSDVLRCVAGELYAGQLRECLSRYRVVVDASCYALVSCYTGEGAIVGFLPCIGRIINNWRESLFNAMVWENVPGAFSSGTPKGEDFRIVL